MHKPKSKATACILLCIDFRFQKNIQQWLQDNDYTGKSDEIVVAGASRDLVKPLKPMHQKALMRQLELSVKLHDPEEIVVIDHQDCGGYAQDDTIPAKLEMEEDMKHHAKWLKKAKEIITEKFPGKVVKTYYATLNGEILTMQ